MKLQTFTLLGLCLSILWAAPAWNIHIHWNQGSWSLVSQEIIEADIKPPRVASGEAERYQGYCLELLDSDGKVVIKKSLGEPGQIHAQFGASSEEHIEVQQAEQDLHFVLPRTSANQQVRIVKNTVELPVSSPNSPPPSANAVQNIATFNLGGAK
jgi:hypothetical protein